MGRPGRLTPGGGWNLLDTDGPDWTVERMEKTSRKPLRILLAVVLALGGLGAATTVVLGLTANVAATPELVGQKIKACESGSEGLFLECVGVAFKSLMKGDTPANVNIALSSLMKTDENIQQRCHAIAHVAGRAALDRLETPEAALQAGSPYCDFGYYHGVLQEAVANVPMEKVVDTLVDICSASAQAGNVDSAYSDTQCSHGVGHAIGLRLKGDLKTSVEYCDKLPEKGRGNCGGGAAMEWATAVNESLENGKIMPANTPKAPYDLCSQLKDPYTEHCLQYASELFPRNAVGDIKLRDWCTSTFEGKDLVGCVTGIGMRMGFQKPTPEQDHVMAACSVGVTKEAQKICLAVFMLSEVNAGITHDELNRQCAVYDAEIKDFKTSAPRQGYETYLTTLDKPLCEVTEAFWDAHGAITPSTEN